jgi:hypothetical protein
MVANHQNLDLLKRFRSQIRARLNAQPLHPCRGACACWRLSRRPGHPCGPWHFLRTGSAARSPSARPCPPATVFDSRRRLARGRALARRRGSRARFCVLGHWASIAAPWRAQESPGPYRLIAGLCGVSDRTAKRWMACPDELPAEHARRLAAYVQGFDGPAVARELEAYAAARDATIKAHGRQVRRTGRAKGLDSG